MEKIQSELRPLQSAARQKFRELTALHLLYLMRVVVAAIMLVSAGCGGGSQGPLLGTPTGTATSTPTSSPTPALVSGINIDYAPESRCSDDNWSTLTPAACNPQLSFTCNPSDTSLSNCPQNCQACYDDDMGTIKNTLNVGTITVYQPNYYILHAAQSAGLKVVLGLFNDSAAGLAQPDSATNCTYSGFPFPYCGANYARALFNGACGACTPWLPNSFCSAGADGGKCGSAPTYVSALNSSLGEFLQNGTVVAIQLGNEILCTNPPCPAPALTAAQFSTAAQNLRSVLNALGFGKIKVVVSLIEGQAAMLCSGDAPPKGVDYIADHVYCASVASVPPSWPGGDNPAEQCLQQVQSVFAKDQGACGAANVFLGETGYNTGCPPVYGQQQIANEQNFIEQLVSAICNKQVSGPLTPFLFEFGDVCPASGCLPGCPDKPREGNGYFGIFHTQDYQTKGALEMKFASNPSLVCP